MSETESATKDKVIVKTEMAIQFEMGKERDQMHLGEKCAALAMCDSEEEDVSVKTIHKQWFASAGREIEEEQEVTLDDFVEDQGEDGAEDGTKQEAEEKDLATRTSERQSEDWSLWKMWDRIVISITPKVRICRELRD